MIRRMDDESDAEPEPNRPHDAEFAGVQHAKRVLQPQRATRAVAILLGWLDRQRITEAV